MSRYGSVTLGLPSALFSTTVESAEASDLEARVNAAIQAVPAGYRIVAITLAGAGDGAVFSVTIEAGLLASVEGGFSTGPTVKCFLAATAEELTALGQTTNPTTGTLADLQVAGASQGLRRMGMFVAGTLAPATSMFATGARPNKNMQAMTTVADGDLACATPIAVTPSPSSVNGGYIGFRVNGVSYSVGDGTKVNVACYFSSDGGVTAKLMKDVVAGDLPYWNGSVAGFELSAATDRIDYTWEVNS